MAHHPFLWTAVLMLAYALADLFSGSGDPEHPWRSAFWGCVACAVVGFFAASWAGVAFAVAWFVWRSPAGSSPAPVGLPAIGSAYLRHAIIIPAAVVAGLFTHHHWPQVGATFAVWAAFATSLAWAYGQWTVAANQDGEANPDPAGMVEFVRSAGYGLAVALVLI
jgi:hypothetical protein